MTEPLAISNLSVGASVDISATATTGGSRTVSFSLTAGSGTGPTPASFALNANGATGTSSFTNSNAAGTADIDITLSSTQNGNRRIDWTATCAAATTAEVTIANTTDGTEPGTDGVLTVSQSVISPTNTVIAYSVGGSATPGSDYTALSGTVTILAGDLTATIDVEVLDDAAIEGDEDVIVTLTSITSGSATLGTPVSATNTIGDEDTAEVTIANTTDGTEPGTDGVLTVSQSVVSPTNTVIAYSVGGSATPGSDYTTLSGTVTILAGDLTATIDVEVLDDAAIEGDEDVIVTLTSITSGSATLGTPVSATNTIGDEDTAEVTIANTTDGTEPGTDGVLTVSQSVVSPTNTVIAYSVGGSATPGSDYTTLSGTVTILAGDLTATIDVEVLDDAAIEGDEDVIVTLTSITSGSATLGTPASATNTIGDEDTAEVTIANTTDGTEPGTDGVLTVSQSVVSPTNTVIAYSVGGSATPGSDYTALSGTVTILAGDLTATIDVEVLDDAAIEGNEDVIVTLTSITSGAATLGTPASATNTIGDEDTAEVTIANTTDGTEPGTDGVLTVSQSVISPTNTVIAYSVGGSATPGSDYTTLSGTVTILAGDLTATIDVEVLDDAAIEGNEDVIVTLTSITSGAATLGTPASATNTIGDEDTAEVTIANTTDGTEPGTDGVLTVSQSVVSPTNTVIAYSVGGSATPGSDYTTLSGTVTILAGDLTATIDVEVLDDAAIEGNEDVIVTLTSITSGSATLGTPASATNTIGDEDTAEVTIANTTDGTEPGTDGVLTVSQSVISPTNTVIAYSVGGSATPGSDYTTLSGTVTILAGDLTATIDVEVLDDGLIEGDEDVIVTLTSVTSGAATLGTPLSATNTIGDEDTAEVTIANTTDGTEPGTDGVLTVSQSVVSPTNTVIAYSVGGSATPGSDYTALSGTVTILAGDLTATIDVEVLDDAAIEGNEDVIVTLTSITSGSATLGTPASATNTIGDEDTAEVTITNTTDGTEPGTDGVLTVSQSVISPTNTVIAYSVGGSATPGSDYTTLSGTVTILAGDLTATIDVEVLDDAAIEGDEDVIVTLTSVTSGAATLGTPASATNTIGDEDTAEVTIANTTDGTEPGTDGVLTVNQSVVSPTNTVIAYSVGGSATPGSDYTTLSGTVTILAGDLTATIDVEVLDDAAIEGDEDVIVTLTSVTSGAATLGTPLSATNTIGDEDTAEVTIANTTDGTEPGTDGVLTVSQSVVSPTNTVIAYSVGGSATPGSDYTTLSGTVTILAGDLTATIDVEVLDDAAIEGNEDVIVTLTSITSGSATLGTPASATNTIGDEDTAEVTIANTTDGTEPGTDGVLTVSQSVISPTNTVIAYSVGGSATPGSDYTTLSGTVTILAGDLTATIDVEVLDDGLIEGDEDVIVTLTSVTSGAATLGTPLSATNTIGDEDTAEVTIANTTDGTEPGTDGVLTVSQSVVSPTNTVIAYSVGGSATPGSDYTALSGTVTILAGDLTATIDVEVLDDAAIEGNEDVIVTLTSITSGSATLGTPASATNTIGDEDTAEVTITNTTDGTEPGTDGVLTVSQSVISPTNTVIAYSVGGSATPGSDYTTLSGTVTILAGDLTATIDVEVLDDAAIEGDEDVIVTLTSITSGSATLGTPVSATNTIGDEDTGINDLIAQAFESQVHNFVSRRMTLISRHSPTIHRNHQGRNCSDKNRHGFINVAGDEEKIDGEFAFMTGQQNCSDQTDLYIWTEGQFSFFHDNQYEDQSTNSNGDFAIGFAGLAIPVNEYLTMGLIGQVDWLEDRLETGLGEVSGTGWAFGPYLSLQFSENLQFDARAMWGQSQNTARQTLLGNDYSGDFDTDRWLVEGILSGKTTFDSYKVTPSAKLFYMQENWNGYSVTDGNRQVDVPGGESAIGTLSSRLEISHLQQYQGYLVEPFASAEVTWAFKDPGIYNSTGTLQQNDDISAALSAGIEVSNQNTFLRFEGSYGGFGTIGLENVTGKISIKHKF